MALAELAVTGFRAFADTGVLPIGPVTGIVGRNDCGKSALLHALKIFFEPPKKGLQLTDLHMKDVAATAVITLGFRPEALATTRIRIDAKNEVDICDDRLVARDGLLRVRLSLSANGDSRFELQIADVDLEDIYPLALKRHDELLALLDTRGLPAKKAGKETNQAKRTTLRSWAENSGGVIREDWVDATAIEKQVRTILPTFVYFGDTARFGIDETSVQNQFKSIVDKAIAAHKDAQAIEQAIRQAVQEEFDKVFSRLAKLTPSVAGIAATTHVSWKKAVDGIELSWADPLGVDLPYELRGAGIRRLFMVAYFQYLAADQLYDQNGTRYIFAIEEPELHLHPGAQRDLIDALREIGELGHSVVFTTHSPVFATAPRRQQLFLVRRDATAAQVLVYPAYSASTLAHELGVEASDRLVGKNHVVLVEGPRDVEFFTGLLQALFAAGDTALNPVEVLFLQCGGMDNLHFVATTECIAEAGLKWAILMDSDRTTTTDLPNGVAQALTSAPPPTCKDVRVLERSFIESYLDPAEIHAETGVSCRMPHFGKATDLAGQPLPDRNWKAIKKASAAIAKRMGYAKLKAAGQRSDGSCEWVDHFESIRLKFGL